MSGFRRTFPIIGVRVDPPAAAPGALTPSLPGPPTSNTQINDVAPSPLDVYSSARTETRIAEQVAEEIYNFDALVASNLSI